MKDDFLSMGRVRLAGVGGPDMAAGEVGGVDGHLPEGKIILVTTGKEK